MKKVSEVKEKELRSQKDQEENPLKEEKMGHKEK